MSLREWFVWQDYCGLFQVLGDWNGVGEDFGDAGVDLGGVGVDFGDVGVDLGIINVGFDDVGRIHCDLGADFGKGVRVDLGGIWEDILNR